MQAGEYGTDEDEEMSPMFPNAIEVFDLAESEDMLSPVEMDPEKLTHKFKEVSAAGSHLSSSWSDLSEGILVVRKEIDFF